MRKLRIAQVAPLAESVPPVGYGGTELVVHLLTEELVKRGHEVTLFASGDSNTKGQLVRGCDTALRTNHDIPSTRWAAYELALLTQLDKRQQEFDIIHNHMGWVALPMLAHLHTPTITTLHNHIKSYCKDIYSHFRKLPYVAISKAFQHTNYPDILNYAGVVYNGIDLGNFYFAENLSQDYLLFLGRLCNDKGTLQAIDFAERVGMRLLLAGKIDARDKEYYEELIAPRINGRQVEYVGEVNHQQKQELYQNAYATIYPIQFEEPFGLVMVESLACGTPVIALRRGSVSEVLADGETAITGTNVDELVARFSEISQISRAACRERVEKLFTVKVMVDSYLAVYDRQLALVGGI